MAEFLRDAEPNKYRVTVNFPDGTSLSEFAAVTPDPGTAEKVKDHLVSTRNDWYLKGVRSKDVTVEVVGPQTPADKARIAGVLSAVTPVAPK